MRRRSLATVAAGVLLALAATGCSFSDDEPTSTAASDDETNPPGATGGSWTILMYSIADTDLEPFMMDDLDELGSIAGDSDLHITALVDRAGEYSDAGVVGLDDWEGAKLLELTQPGEAAVVEDLGDVDTGDPEVLAAFIEQGIKRYPADHYALVISDHGASWPGVGGDESADYNSLSLAELDAAIGQGIEAGGIESLDLLGFDACLMATYEVASTLAPHAQRMLASQELEPGHGWDYTAFAGAAAGADVDELGGALIDGFAAQAREEETDSSITLSLVDLTRMGEVDAAMSELTAALRERVNTLAPTVGRTLAQTLGFGRTPDPIDDVHMSDLGILAGELSVDAVDIAPEAEAVVRAINDVVLDRVDGQATQGATGLSIYFPAKQDYYDPAYGDLSVDTGWNEFLQTYYTAGTEIPEDEQASFVQDEATITFADNGLYIAGDFEPAAEGNISSAYISYGFWLEDGTLALFGDEDSSYESDGDTTIEDFFDLTMLQVTDGVDTMNAYLSLGYSEDGMYIIDVPMRAQDADDKTGETAEEITLELGVDPDTGDIVTEVYYVLQEETGMYGEWTPTENTLLFPEWQYVSGDGTSSWEPTEGPGLWADLDSLNYSLVKLEPGTEFWIALTAVDFGGNEDWVDATVTIP